MPREAQSIFHTSVTPDGIPPIRTMMNKRVLLILLPVVAFALVGCATKSSPATETARSSEQAEGANLVRTQASEVCMMNDRYMGGEQMPIEIDGKTYYGCCAGCQARLEHDEETRYAIDPVSGARVDKATAIIGRGEKNRVYYFENIENYASYHRP